MATNPQDQEIDLGQVFHKIGGLFQKLVDSIFDGILFVKRNIIIFLVLLISGGVLGYFIDKNKSYTSEIIVHPNFDSVDYLYAKIDLFNTKKADKDSTFLRQLGFKDLKKLGGLKIEPIVDIYNYVEGVENYERDNGRFDLLKLMAEDGSINQLIEQEVLSKNYPNHRIIFTSTQPLDPENIVTPLLKYLNDSDYFNALQEQTQKNIEYRVKEIDSTISQINTYLAQKSSSKGNSSSSVNINEDNDVGEIFKVKESLIVSRTRLLVNLIQKKQTIKEIGSTLNVIDKEGTKGKMKLILPFLFIIGYLFIYLFLKFYKSQIRKRKI